MGSSPRILLIDQSESDAQEILQALLENGYAPSFKKINNRELLQIVLQQSAWDIAICDDQLQDLSVLEILQIVQSSDLNLPFIVVSNSFNEDTASAMIRAGASDYLFKKHLKHLIATIEQKLQEVEICRAQQQSEVTVLRLAAIVESSEDAMISTDLQGHILTWNSGAEKLYGYSATEAQGKLLTRLIQPHNNNLLTIPLENQFSRVVDCRQVTQQRKTGELIDIFFTVSLIRTVEDHIVGFAIVARKISECQMIQRMKDEFISIINHELRTPLASLQGSIELLLTGKLGDLSDRGRRMLEIAASNIDRLVQLTSGILDLEELSSGKVSILKEFCDVGDLVSEFVKGLQSVASQRDIHLLSVTPQPIWVHLDPPRIRQVLHHLVMNAIQFSPVGGQIQVEIERCDNEKRPSGKLQCPHVLIKVKDSGQGIPPDKLGSIFGQFQQADASDTRSHRGAGMGLAICRSIIQQHQGSLWAESVLGQGSTFYLALPLQCVAVPNMSGNTRSELIEWR